MTYIVMIGVPSSYSYSGEDWSVDRVFCSMESAKKHIAEQTKIHGIDVGYDIDTQEVYA